MEKISQKIVKYRNWILLAATLLLIPCIIGYLNTRVNYDILTYLPQECSSMQAQDYLSNDFNLAGTAMVIVDDMPEKEVQALEEKIREVPGVKSALWKTDLADSTVPAEILPDALKNTLYSGDSTMIVVTFTEAAASDSTMEAIGAIQEIVDGNGHVAGFSVITADTKALIDKEAPVYSAFAVVLCLVVLSLGLKSWLAPFIFLLGMAYPIIYNMGTNYFLKEISYVTKALSMILLLAVSMDYSIFLLHRYQEEKTIQPTKEEAMAKAIYATWTSITSSSVTTIAGFLALLAMQLTLGRDIGIVMAKGVLLAVMSTILILPSLLMFFDPWIEKWQHPVLIRPLVKPAAWVVRHYKGLALLLVILFVPAIYCQMNTAQYYDLAASLPQSLDSVTGTLELKEKFNMNTTHFLIVDDSLSQKDMDTLISKVEEVDGISSVIAYGKFAGPLIPYDMEPEALEEILHADGKRLILVNSGNRTATDEINSQLDALDAILLEYQDSALIAGEGAMTQDLIATTNVDFQMVNVVSVIAIFIIIALTFKSLLLPVLLVAAIELSISINMGIPYLTQTSLPFIAGIVVGTIQLGACIDYAILLTSRFKEELAAGKNPKQAIQTAVTKTSPFIITSGLSFFAACSGVSLIAQMDLIKSLCTLLGRGALISVVVILTILPSLLLLFNKAIAKTTKGWPKPVSVKEGN